MYISFKMMGVCFLKSLFKNWTIFEICLIIISPIVVLTLGIFFKSDALTISASLVGIFCAIFLSKGLVLGQFFGIGVSVLYSIASYKNGFYGEMIIYFFIMFPMYLWGIIEWTKHKNINTETVEVNTIKRKEWAWVSVCAIIVFVAFYFLLKALNTNELLVSTFSVVDNIFAVYLLARRSKYGFVSYIVNDFILIVLWGIPILQGNLMLIAMLMNPVINLINDLYGVVNWTKLQKKQSE